MSVVFIFLLTNEAAFGGLDIFKNEQKITDRIHYFNEIMKRPDQIALQCFLKL